jgi:hypothetical protein
MTNASRPNCNTCGRFFTMIAGVAWKMVYSGFPPEPDHEIYRCADCVAKVGEFSPSAGIKPEFSCGVTA